jgi:hypothetical protein
MGDKCRKEVHKKAVQKRFKDDAAAHEKRAMTEDKHHPTSGHTGTPSHPTTSDERDPSRPQTDQSSGKGHGGKRDVHQGSKSGPLLNRSSA